MNDAAPALARVLATERARVVARLARTLGLAHLALADDAVQEAGLRALQRWPQDGLPAQPAAWLYTVARGVAIDQLRRGGREQAWPEDEQAAADWPTAPPVEGRFAGELQDDELALLFAACHPALPAASQLALALQLFTGLPHEVLAAALLCTPAALAQRLQRARQLLRGQPLAVPAGAQLPPRREAVLAVLALAFHVGARLRARSGGADPAGAELCWNAIRLARALAAHPAAAHATADALAAMLLLQGARLTGQLDAEGEIVLLPGQPRDRWDAGMVRLGLAHLQAAQRATALSRWHLLAGIAAEHASAPSHARTDWAAIAHWYTLLLQMDGSAAPRLAHAIALAEAGDAARARQHLLALQAELPSPLQPHLLAALARCSERLGDLPAACAWLQQAAGAARHPADARVLQRRLDGLRGLQGLQPPALQQPPP